jgi:hypothetical protein
MYLQLLSRRAVESLDWFSNESDLPARVRGRWVSRYVYKGPFQFSSYELLSVDNGDVASPTHISSTRHTKAKHDPAPYGHTQRMLRDVVWTHNSTFGSDPSAASEAAWQELIPLGRGFVRHARLTGGEEKSVSVFHELHCLVSWTFMLDAFLYAFPLYYLSSTTTVFGYGCEGRTW